MAISHNKNTKMSHVNMMTDTIVANLPPDALRSIIRSLLVSQPDFTTVFEESTKSYLQSQIFKPGRLADDEGRLSRENIHNMQKRIRCMLGCGLCYQSLPLLGSIVKQATQFLTRDNENTMFVQSVDADIVQAATAVQKAITMMDGGQLSVDNVELLQTFYDNLVACLEESILQGAEFPFERGLTAVADLLGYSAPNSITKGFNIDLDTKQALIPPTPTETFQLGNRQLPRIFSGLWQLSSPAWGSAPASKIIQQFARHVRSGFTAFDMADHYGDAEIIFGRFRSSYTHADSIFAATKYCVFQPMTVSREAIRANVAERCQRLHVDKIDLLQFHWQFYDDIQYIKALKYLQEDDRVGMLGLCNFDTEHMQRVLESGITVHSNQVQFSLIDSRPLVKMSQLCAKYNVKLLTYGTLCGGFLAEEWVGKAEPGLYDSDITPSQRKYFSMIQSWGSWSLFQELLQALKSIGSKHRVSISNIATRWVLDYDCVGAVIVGTRMGVSEHVDENAASFGWSLDGEDQHFIEDILQRSHRAEMFESMGDCGGEYR
ncbi:NADP-dependent oxidoreductase domain-containing protein [Talaromyces proteolyticus]|uniref:NADP-dependent oxidoreductase domain-containing protein n=1 Tax=Talaromyces proteolyticus TaxID=1131652 RepID=A0AAD4PSJ1_9EURO|nr:NADP-dependent oxidoreductase domain-containing protein [Talaromyces proteolyticus]KAH8691461.1 NADP-dependent oxidoreductase domain-containing protein [Talaromyces proteolyticus]